MSTTTLTLPDTDPVTINTIEYDFEDYAVTHGIPETLDPLPYRKTGSVFEADNEAGVSCEPVLTSAKHDPRLRTVVCRHWLRDLCMKGAACEFLHQYDLSKMPICRHGDRCKIKDCPFRHISEESRMDCAFYRSGFCVHGLFCRYKHNVRPREDLPVVADFSSGVKSKDEQLNQTTTAAQTISNNKKPPAKPNEFYKISLCKHFLMGNCPYGENCHFAHGEHELRQYPGKKEEEMTVVDTSSPLDYYEGGASGGGKPIPILEPSGAHYYICQAATQQDLAISTVLGEWFVTKDMANELDGILEAKKKEDDDKLPQIMLFFTVCHSRHIQGAALITSAPSKHVKKMRIKKRKKGDGKSNEAIEYSYFYKVEWYRTTELSMERALQAAPELQVPTETTTCQRLEPTTGEALMKAVWNAPLVTLYESTYYYEDDDEEEDDEEDPPAADAVLTDFRAPQPGSFSWPTTPGPGFIFGCSSDTMDECLGRGLFGLPAHMKAAANLIVPGTTIFLFNVTDRLLFGIFEALTPALMNIEPTAFSRNPKATTSPFPVQIRVRVGLECPPLEDADLNDTILRTRGPQRRIGAVTHAEAEALATLLAQQCGALKYMVEYRKQQQDGTMNMRPPPIALPPRKIKHDTPSSAEQEKDTKVKTDPADPNEQEPLL